MPRKTRKQKERAQKKRAFEATSGEFVKGEFDFSFDEQARPQNVRKGVKKADKSTPLQDSSLVVRDMARTLLLALGIFSLEIVVYFVWFK